MEITTDARTLADALAVLKRYAGTGSGSTKSAELVALRVTEGGGSMVLRRFAWKTFADVSASIGGNGGTPGSAYVDAAALADAVKGRKGTLSITADGERVTITTDAGTASLRAADGSDFPAPVPSPQKTFAIIRATEVDALRGVLTAAASGIDARAVLTGVYFDRSAGEVVATDTYRMAAARISSVMQSGIVPAGVLRIAAATTTGGMELYSDPNAHRFLLTYRAVKGTKNAPRTVAFSVAASMIEGPYPNYGAIVDPARDADAYLWNVTDAAGTADVLASFFNKRNTPVMLAASGSAVIATATLPDGAGTREAYPPIVNNGSDEALNGAAFNPSFFADAVKHAGSGSTVRIRDGLKAAYFDGGDRYALLMPMRVS